MSFIDSHAHVYLQELATDRENMMERADKAGITRIFMPAIDNSTHELMVSMEHQYPEVCHAMMGLHPCSVRGNYVEELAIVEDYLTKRKFIAIGEIGLDYYWDLSFKDQQLDAFQRQIDWALHYDLPIVIHSRNSTDDCINMVSKNQNGKLKGVFHCFSGTTEQAMQIIDLGFYLGIGGVVTYKNSGLDKVMQEVSLDRIILETDAPYLSPVPFRGKRNEPAYIVHVAEKLAILKSVSVDEIGAMTTENAMTLFKI